MLLAWQERCGSPPKSLSAPHSASSCAVRKGEGNPCRSQDQSLCLSIFWSQSWAPSPVAGSAPPDPHPPSWASRPSLRKRGRGKANAHRSQCLTGFQQPSGSQEHRPLIRTGLSLRGFVQRSLPSTSPRTRRRGFQRCLGMLGSGHCPSGFSVLLLVPPAHLFPLLCLPCGGRVSAAPGRGFSSLRAPPSVSLGSTPGCCSLAIVLEPRQGSHMVLGQHVGKCESDRDTGQHCQAKSMLCWGSSPGHSLRLYF